MRRNEAPMLQQIYRIQPDSVGDKKVGIRANHYTIASDDALNPPLFTIVKLLLGAIVKTIKANKI